MASTTTLETITSTDGTPIAYERTGSGPPLVLVHGTGADYTSWNGVRPALAEHCTVYAIDRRGRGESGDVDDYQLGQEAEDVAALVDSTDEPAVLFGHSYGALCALEAAIRTNNLRKLILYEPVFPVSDHELYSEDVLVEMETLLDAGENEAALVLFYQEVPELTPAQIDMLRSAPNWPSRVDAAHTVLRELQAESAYEFDASRFEEMSASTMLLFGSESPKWARAITDAANDALPNSRIVTLDGHGHVAYYTAPELFAETILEFVHESN